MQIISCQRLSSTLLEGDRACPGAQVNFTCTTNGSLVMSWRSDEYIGPNGARLEFTSADGVGSRMTSPINPSAFATLVRVDGNRVFESVLTLTVSDSYQTASVTCSEVGQGASTTTFTLLGMWSYLAAYNNIVIRVSLLLSSVALPGIPQNVTANMISLTSEDCVILLQWMPPSVAKSSINHYVVDSSSGRFTTIDTSVKIALLIHNSTTYYIRIHAVDYCDRDGPSTNDTLGLLLTNTTLSPPVTESINVIGGLSTQSPGKILY